MNKDSLKKLIKNPIYLYFILNCICLGIVVFSLYLSKGDLFNKFFFSDKRDTGMDFFHSIEYLKGNDPYESFHTLYPPLANLLFKALYCILPVELTGKWPANLINYTLFVGTSYDLRTYQSTMVLFIAFIVLSVFGLSYFCNKVVKTNGGNGSTLLLFCTITSYGFLMAIERGNIIIIAFLFLLFFIFNYKSDNPVIRELSIICLAISAGLKIYPAIFGLLLIKDKKWGMAFRAIIYGLLSFFVPLLFFKGGIINNTMLWFKILNEFSTKSERTETIVNMIYSFNHLLYIGEQHRPIIKAMMLLCSIAGLISSDKIYKSLLYISVLIILFTGEGTYVFLFCLSSLLSFILEEKVINKNNVVFFVIIMLAVLPIPIFDIKDRYAFDIIICFISCSISLYELMYNKLKKS